MRTFFIVLGGIALVVTLTAAVSQGQVEELASTNLQLVRVTEVEPAPATLEETFAGRVASPSEGTLAFTVGGRIVELPVEVGQSVREGQVVAAIDSEAWSLAEESAEAALARVDVELEQVRRDLERAVSLGNAVTDEEVEQRATAVRGLEAERRQVLSNLMETRRLLREAVLRAPYSGVVTDRFVRLNEVVDGGRPVVRLSGNARWYEVDVLLPESALPKVVLGDIVRVSFPLSEMEDANGRVMRISAHGNEQRGLFPVKVALEGSTVQGQEMLRPGLQARVSFSYPTDKSLVLVPLSAVVSDPRGTAVTYRLEGSSVRETVLSVERLVPSGALVTGNLSPGTLVVSSGHFALADGQTVEVAE